MRAIAKIPHLAEVMDATLVLHPSASQAKELDAVVGWGHKRTARKARRYAETHGLPYIRLEDGFLRSASVERRGPPLSLVVDDLGIYYDARSPSRLEALLNQPAGAHNPLSDQEILSRARNLRQRIVRSRLTKYNDTLRPPPDWLKASGTRSILVADQSLNDASILLGNADAESFRKMFDCALEDPEATVVVKAHPDVMLGRRRGYLPIVDHPRIRWLRQPIDPAELLELVSEVYTVTSQLGFDALLRQKPVRCFGAPFYAGWGLTRDEVPLPRRKQRPSLDQLTAAALLLYPRYLDPQTGRRCELETVMDHLERQRAAFQENTGVHYCFGFSRWKRGYLRQYKKAPESRVVFIGSVEAVKRRDLEEGARVLVWGMRDCREIQQLAKQRGVPLYKVEDGFLRSVGLGSDFTAPASLVFDPTGLYYDARQPSGLEELLESTQFSDAELRLAKHLRERIVAAEISKYNLGNRAPLVLPKNVKRPIILVPGQVEDDASILYGSEKVTSNQALLTEVRRRNPHAYILFKPHPEVVSGNRRGQLPPGAAALADQMVENAALGPCLALADEVHTMTSLVGFEGLLRQRKVVCFGKPFYAGWGLTSDVEPVPRRTRRLTLDELTAGALLRYPRYYCFRTKAFVSAHQALDELTKEKEGRGGAIPRGWVSRQWRRGRALLTEVLHAR